MPWKLKLFPVTSLNKRNSKCETIEKNMKICFLFLWLGTVTRSKWRRKGLISTYRLNSPSWRKARGGAKAETATEECCLWLALGCGQLSYTAQDHLPGDDSTCHGLDPPTSMNNEENPQTSPQSNLMKAISPARFALPGVSGWQPKLTMTVFNNTQFKGFSKIARNVEK